MIHATTPLTPALRATLTAALTPGDDDDATMFDAGDALYLATLRATPDGAPIGDLIDVVELYDLDA